MQMLSLNNGVEIPQMALGVFQLSGYEEARQACLSAFSMGYRHVDSAHHYGNEAAVGAAVRACGLPREALWITSKLWPNEYADEAAVDRMLQRFGLAYLDLILLHQQVGDYMAGYRNLEKAYRAGKVRAIGLSNFESARLEEVLAAATVPPQVLQVECHPYFQQRALKARLAPYGTRMACWFPLGHGDPGLMSHPVIARIGAKYGRTGAQVILRWHLQEGHIPLPRAVNPAHQRQNLAAFDFTLDAEDMRCIRAMDQGRRYWTLSLAQQEEKFLGILL